MYDPKAHSAAESADAEGSRLVRVALLAATVATGLLTGAGVYTFSYAEGTSYLSDDPAACANCHIMTDQFEAWQRGPHQHVAVCNDCHTASGFVPKYASKAINGFNHSFAFTTGRFPEPIQINAFNRWLAETSCRSCHGDLVHAVDVITPAQARLSCTRCHTDVGH